MAFSDFDFNGSQTTVSHLGAPLNTNPLSNGGSFCRSFSLSQFCKIYYKTTAYGGAFFNVPNTKIVSCRAYMRNDSNITSIVAKDTVSIGTGNVGGYKLSLFNGFGNQIKLVSSNGNDILVSTGTAGYQNNKWFSLRMDVCPISSAADRILCYMEVASSGSTISAPGSGIWNNVINGVTFDITINSTNPFYLPWSNNERYGVAGGYSGGNYNSFVDNLNFSTYTAPV